MGVHVGVSMWGTYVGDVVYGDDVGNVENRMVTGCVACWGYWRVIVVKYREYGETHCEAQ